MTRIGLVGVGFMGWIHYLAYKGLRDAKLAAVCSRDKVKLAGDWRSIRGNFGPPGEMVDLSSVKKYERHRRPRCRSRDRSHRCLQPDASTRRVGDRGT